MTEAEREQLEDLIRAANTLNRQVALVAEESGQQFVSLAKTARRNRLLAWTSITGVILDIALTIVVTVIGVGMAHNTDRIDDFTQQQAQTALEQRRRALCPLYQLFLDSKSEAGRKAAPDPEKYDHAFVVIQKGYDVLKCSSFKGNY